MKLWLTVLVLALACSTGFAKKLDKTKHKAQPAIAATRLSVADIVCQNDKTCQAKDVYPLGVPSWWDWYNGANRPIGRTLAPGYTENVGYGLVHELVGSAQPNKVKAYIGVMQVWLMGPDNVWRLSKEGPVNGANYRADFKNNASKDWQAVRTGKITQVEPEPDWNVHFWNDGSRAPAKPNDVFVYIRYYAKASANNAIVACGGDDQYGEGGKFVSFGQGNHMLLTTRWQSITYTNAPANLLKKLPANAL